MSDNIVNFPEEGQIEQQALAWVIKLEGDKAPSKQQLTSFRAWLAQSPDHRRIFKTVAAGWDDMNVLSGLVIPKGQLQSEPGGASLASGLVSLLLCLLSPLLLLLSLSGRNLSQLAEAFRPRPAMVAISTFGVVIAMVFVLQPPGPVTYQTALGEQSSYTLADGSTLWLNTNSEVVVEYSEALRRISLVSGEAHFDVESNPERPFEVYAGTRMVRAVGTAFSVYRQAEDVGVIVTEGKVALGIVYAANASAIPSPPDAAAPLEPAEKRVLDNAKPAAPGQAKAEAEILGTLKAGQSVLIPAGAAESKHYAVTDHETAELKRRLAWLQGQLIYAGESLESVIKEVSRYTPVYIELLDPELAAIRIGGQFQVGETEALFGILELGFGLNITRLNEFHVQVSAKEK